jgi:NADH:ubiquinone reductase (H+-translocating)
MAAARLCHQRGRKLTISLVAPGDDLVIRPRLYEPGPGAMRVPQTPEVFATGDAARADAEAGQVTIQSCQHAIPLGRYAGHNAAADLLGHPAAEFRPEPYETCLDLGAAGAVFTTGWDRAVRLTGEPAKERKRRINQRAIYPPLDDAAAILAEGDLARTWADAA